MISWAVVQWAQHNVAAPGSSSLETYSPNLLDCLVTELLYLALCCISIKITQDALAGLAIILSLSLLLYIECETLKSAHLFTVNIVKFCHTYILVNDFFFNLAQSLTLLLHFFVVVLLVMVIYYFALSIFFSNTDLVILCNNYSSMLWLMTKFIITQCILRGSKTEPSGISLKTSSQTKSAPLINTFEY